MFKLMLSYGRKTILVILSSDRIVNNLPVI